MQINTKMLKSFVPDIHSIYNSAMCSDYSDLSNANVFCYLIVDSSFFDKT